MAFSKSHAKRAILSAVGLLSIAGGYVLVALGNFGDIGACTARLPTLEAPAVDGAQYFSANYQGARSAFLEAARSAGGHIQSIENPAHGPDGGDLFTDIARFGPEDAAAVLVVNSATHGVEGFAGSAIQNGLLRDGLVSRLPHGTALLMVHALNPHGMAHLRRFTEENIDLNRNFPKDWAALSENEAYESLRDAISPRSISFWSEVRAWARLLTVRSFDRPRLQRAVTSGQHSHPEGLFYGGTSPAWGHRTLLSVVSSAPLAHAERVVVIDVHAGLGEFGQGELILNVPDDHRWHQEAVRIWGREMVTSTFQEGHISVNLEESLKLGVSRQLESQGVQQLTAVSLEFGTLPPTEVFKALRAESWLHHHAGADEPRAQAIQQCLLRAFYPDSDEWKASVWTRGREVVDQALEGLQR
jgi:hypothetical protein